MKRLLLLLTVVCVLLCACGTSDEKATNKKVSTLKEETKNIQEQTNAGPKVLPTVEKITYETTELEDFLMISFENQNESDIPQLVVNVTYYDKENEEIDMVPKYINFIGAGRKVVYRFSYPEDADFKQIAYDHFEVTLEINEEEQDVNAIDQISMESNIGLCNRIYSKVTNNGEEDAVVGLVTIYYQGGKAISCEESFEHIYKAGETYVETIRPPYDENAEMMPFDDYEVIVNFAYLGESNDEDMSAYLDKMKFETMDLERNVIVKATNQNDELISEINAKIVYYDKDNKMLQSDTSDTLFINAEETGLLVFTRPIDEDNHFVSYDHYDIWYELSTEEFSYYTDLQQELEIVKKNVEDSKITYDIINHSSMECYYATIITLFKKDGNYVDIDTNIEHKIAAGATISDYVYEPEDLEGDPVDYDDYEVYVNIAYGKNK